MRLSPLKDLPRKGAPPRRAVYFDMDGALVVPTPRRADPTDLEFAPNAVNGLRLLSDMGYLLFAMTEQPGIALGQIERQALQRLERTLTDRLDAAGVPLQGFYACPHAPATPMLAGCGCRRPHPGLLLEAARDHAIDLTRSWMVGGRIDDLEAGRRAGCRSLLLDADVSAARAASPLRAPDTRVADLLAAARAIVDDDATRAARRPGGSRSGRGARYGGLSR